MMTYLRSLVAFTPKNFMTNSKKGKAFSANKVESEHPARTGSRSDRVLPSCAAELVGFAVW